MARGAAVARVDRFAASGIAGENFRHNIAKAANVSGDAGDFLLRQIPGLRHIRRDTVLDEALKSVIENGIPPDMPEAWYLSQEEIASVAAYVRRLGHVLPDVLPDDPARAKAIHA